MVWGFLPKKLNCEYQQKLNQLFKNKLIEKGVYLNLRLKLDHEPSPVANGITLGSTNLESSSEKVYVKGKHSGFDIWNLIEKENRKMLNDNEQLFPYWNYKDFDFRVFVIGRNLQNWCKWLRTFQRIFYHACMGIQNAVISLLTKKL